MRLKSRGLLTKWALGEAPDTSPRETGGCGPADGREGELLRQDARSEGTEGSGGERHGGQLELRGEKRERRESGKVRKCELNWREKGRRKEGSKLNMNDGGESDSRR